MAGDAQGPSGLQIHPMDQFVVKPLFGGDHVAFYTVTNVTLWMAVAVLCVILLLVIGTRGRAIVPSRAQSLAELAYGFVHKMVEDVAGRDGLKYFPYIMTLFMFVMFSNMLGLVPLSFTTTSHIAVTAVLAVAVFLTVTIIGFVKNGAAFLGLFWVTSAPLALRPILAVIELISYFAKLLFATGVLLATALFFGMFFIYPLIRTQVREEGKLRAMTESLSARSQTLEHAALTDSLTGMQNRRFFDDALREYIEEFRKIDKPIGLMILDLDHFKQVNDTHGHDVGDLVLKSVADCLKDMTRYHDVVARLGGEEFAVVAPNMDDDMLGKFAERIRKAVASLAVVTGNVRLKVTTSVGLAVWDRHETAEEFFRRADKHLYQAKRLGRNRVCA